MSRRARRTKPRAIQRRRAEPPAERTLAIRDDYITLAQLLKLAGVIGTGGEAKHYLAGAAVIVNGEAEQRRGRKLRPGDRIVAPGAAPILLAAAGDEEGEGPDEESEEESAPPPA